MPIKQREFLPTSPEEVSKRIQETRESRGISASELARLVGVTPTAVWNWEKNSITPRRPALEAIAKVLGVTTDYLVTGRGGNGIAGNGVAEQPKTADSIPAIIEDARARLAQVTGMALDRIKLNVQFTTE